MAIKPVNEEHKKAIVASRKRKANGQQVTPGVKKILNKYDKGKGTNGSKSTAGLGEKSKDIPGMNLRGNGSGVSTKPKTTTTKPKKPTTSSGSKSKLAALNTQKRRDQYTQRGWAQDATTKLKSAQASTTPAATAAKASTTPAAKASTTTVNINPFSKPSNTGSVIGGLNVKDNKALVTFSKSTGDAPTVGTPRQEQRKVKQTERKVKQTERKANRASNKASRVLNRENKKATREATKETNQARKAVKKSLGNLGGTRKEKRTQKNNEFEAGKPTASTVATKGLNTMQGSGGNEPTIRRQNNTIANIEKGIEASRIISSALSMNSPVKMGQTMQGVAPVQNNPYQDVNQVNANFSPQAQQRAQQMQMPPQQSPMFKKDFPDLNKDGKITKADILMGRGVKK